MSRHMLIAMLLLATATSAANAQPATDARSTGDATDAKAATSASDAVNAGDARSARPNSDAGAKRPAKSTSKSRADRDATARRSASDDGAASTQPAARADETAADARDPAADEVKTLSGISILGNQEAPKSLVIVPWKSSEIGDMPGLSRLLDDSVQPIDKEVFMRELDYYEIRSSSR